jgi:hypothetical protein
MFWWGNQPAPFVSPLPLLFSPQPLQALPPNRLWTLPKSVRFKACWEAGPATRRLRTKTIWVLDRRACLTAPPGGAGCHACPSEAWFFGKSGFWGAGGPTRPSKRGRFYSPPLFERRGSGRAGRGGECVYQRASKMWVIFFFKEQYPLNWFFFTSADPPTCVRCASSKTKKQRFQILSTWCKHSKDGLKNY